jgi:hypothetical protein
VGEPYTISDRSSLVYSDRCTGVLQVPVFGGAIKGTCHQVATIVLRAQCDGCTQQCKLSSTVPIQAFRTPTPHDSINYTALYMVFKILSEAAFSLIKIMIKEVNIFLSKVNPRMFSC